MLYARWAMLVDCTALSTVDCKHTRVHTRAQPPRGPRKHLWSQTSINIGIHIWRPSERKETAPTTPVGARRPLSDSVSVSHSRSCVVLSKCVQTTLYPAVLVQL